VTLLGLDEAVAALRSGGVVALPTDTVYGIGASLEHPEAVEALFTLKRRPGAVALPVVAASAGALAGLVSRWPRDASRLADEFWPGALTIVVEARGSLGALVHSATSRVGFRVPDDDLLVAVLAATGPLALTSANEHGAAPCVTAEVVREVFAGRHELAGVLDGGRRDAAVSTVVDFDGEGWRVVREGAITVSRLSAALR
jgi:tRNA threonylcarbamoyl adenosine modification protein (Sua5/YciO/YrdC/YwlC family)